MEQSNWLGLVLGFAIGAVYGLVQWRELKRKEQLARTRGLAVLMLGAASRMLFLVAVLAAVLLWTDVDKYWFLGSLAVTYGIWFLFKMRELLSTGK